MWGTYGGSEHLSNPCSFVTGRAAEKNIRWSDENYFVIIIFFIFLNTTETRNHLLMGIIEEGFMTKTELIDKVAKSALQKTKALVKCLSPFFERIIGRRQVLIL